MASEDCSVLNCVYGSGLFIWTALPVELDLRHLYRDRVVVARKVRRFSGGVCDLGLHVVWCPKYRRPVLDGRVAERLDELIRQKADERGWEIIALEVMPDHVHLFVKHDPKSSASYVANQFNGFTSRVLRAEFARCGSAGTPTGTARRRASGTATMPRSGAGASITTTRRRTS
ncbi:IS200/IS605 family transposase [Streptomyces tubercidicus]|uniref:IS200/IS605 family transposase n=1 Tax=Streptomyces tubercidicus TaxID=47759 RepID=UPI0036CCA3CA